jgi:hypothetical protein
VYGVGARGEPEQEERVVTRPMPYPENPALVDLAATECVCQLMCQFCALHVVQTIEHVCEPADS